MLTEVPSSYIIKIRDFVMFSYIKLYQVISSKVSKSSTVDTATVQGGAKTICQALGRLLHRRP